MTLLCKLIGHRPALVVEKCRCRRCGRMIRWDSKGGWELVPRVVRVEIGVSGYQEPIVFDFIKGDVYRGSGPLGY